MLVLRTKENHTYNQNNGEGSPMQRDNHRDRGYSNIPRSEPASYYKKQRMVKFNNIKRNNNLHKKSSFHV